MTYLVRFILYTICAVISVFCGAYSVRNAIQRFRDKYYFGFGVSVMLTIMWASTLVNTMVSF